jgi:hypothetical protein
LVFCTSSIFSWCSVKGSNITRRGGGIYCPNLASKQYEYMKMPCWGVQDLQVIKDERNTNEVMIARDMKVALESSSSSTPMLGRHGRAWRHPLLQK